VIKIKSKAFLAFLLLTVAATAAAGKPIKTVSLNDFNGDSQVLTVRDTVSQCDYRVNIKKSVKEVKWHGFMQSQSHWDLVVGSKKCGDIVEQVNMQIVPESQIAILPIKAGSIYYIYPDRDAFIHKNPGVTH